MDNNYLIPANSKKSQLIFGIFRGVDLLIVFIGAIFTLILLFVVSGDTLTDIVIRLLPIGISLLLVMPIAHYHNVLVFLQEFYMFQTGRKSYIWRGWCATYDGFDEEKN